MKAASTVRHGDSSACLEFHQVWYYYDSTPALEDVSLTVAHGEFVAILGPNGSGKTTLLRLALGLVKPSRGTVKLLGERPDRFVGWEQVGYVPQAVEGMSSQFPATVQEVVAQGLYRGFDPLAIWRHSSRAAVAQALEVVGVADFRDRRLSSLSAGQQQRTLIARALVREPELLVLDEPAAGVDAIGQEQLYTLLRRLNQEQGITVVMVSHDIGAVLREATTVACISRALVFHGPPHGITQKELSTLYGLPVDVLVHDLLHEHR